MTKAEITTRECTFVIRDWSFVSVSSRPPNQLRATPREPISIARTNG